MANYSTDPVYGIRYPSDTPTPNVISDFATLMATFAGDLTSKLKGAVPRVTALPTVGPSGSGSLVDGQECYFVADATNGAVWHLRYNLGSASTYKWEYVGGAPLVSQIDTSESTTSSTYGALATAGPTLTIPTLPSGGEFEVVTAALMTTNLANNIALMSYDIGGAGAADVDAIQITQPNGSSNMAASAQRTKRKTLASAVVLLSKYRTGSGLGSTGTFANRFMSVRPIRVG